MPLKPVYGPEDSGRGDLGLPGEPPFTRGVHPTMYRGRLWTMRQYAGFGTAEESNYRYRYLLAQGNTGLSVAFDLPTQMGYDADAPLARGEVGRAGVSVGSREDMGRLFSGIPLKDVSTSMTINATAAILLSLYALTAEAQGTARGTLRGTVQNDILKEYIARSTYIFPPGPSMRLAVDVIEYCAREMPHWNAISVSGYHIREAGATAVQEVAFTLADGLAYLEAAVDRGLTVDAVAPQVSFFFNAQSDVLEEVAKFRAARRLWASLVQERFKPKDARSCMLRFHAQTAGASLTAQQPEVNVVRTAYQALAAVLGGAQSLHTNSMDEALGLPTEKAVRLALRTQQVLAHESGVANVVDPVGGAYAVEWLTDEVESRARKYLDEIERRGGMLKAIERGYPQREIADAAYRYQREVEERRRLVVGVNAFRSEEEPPRPFAVPPSVEAGQARRLRALRRRRDRKRVESSLTRLRKAAEGEENLVPRLDEALKAYATLGEASDALRAVFGEYRPRQEV
ncbi:MAG TPA: methylmalonyl-CoA mutase family protein [Thermoplasmata archaeon]|nr:methylmalonyl-CoA mutase family protein [Thermoplasmata archaeon]